MLRAAQKQTCRYIKYARTQCAPTEQCAHSKANLECDTHDAPDWKHFMTFSIWARVRVSSRMSKYHRLCCIDVRAGLVVVCHRVMTTNSYKILLKLYCCGERASALVSVPFSVRMLVLVLLLRKSLNITEHHPNTATYTQTQARQQEQQQRNAEPKSIWVRISVHSNTHTYMYIC